MAPFVLTVMTTLIGEKLSDTMLAEGANEQETFTGKLPQESETGVCAKVPKAVTWKETGTLPV